MNAVSPVPPRILLERLTLRFGAFTALDQVTLQVEAGEFLTLLGPSGSGKTTILNLICGALAPTEGRLFMDGRDITNLPARERGLGMVFQSYALLPHLTVAENIAYPLKVRRCSRAEIDTAVRRVLDRVGLTAFADRKPRHLSGGQQQRVGIARCLVYSPPIILMDEPLGALDKNLRDQMQEEIKRLHLELATTIIYVTHDQEEALNLSDRICLMNAGGVEQIGTPDALYFRPETRFAATFIGDSNLLHGHLVDAQTFRTDAGRSLRIADPRGLTAGAAAAALIRPEKLLPATGAEPGNTLAGVVETISFVGGMTRVMVATAEGERFTTRTVSSPLAERARPGAEMRLAWSPADVILLPA